MHFKNASSQAWHLRIVRGKTLRRNTGETTVAILTFILFRTMFVMDCIDKDLET